MALQLTYTIPNTTISITNAYHKINEILIVNGGSIVISTLSYKDSTDRSNNMPITSSVRRFVILSSDDDYNTYFSETALKVVDKSVIIRAYEYLKTLSEFSGATDV